MKAREITFQATSQGRMPGHIRREFDDLLRSLAGKRVKVTVRLQERQRSGQQNKFYQGPFIESFRQHLLACGARVSHDDIHAGLRDAHAKNAYTLTLPGDNQFRIPPSTARLSTVDFESFLEEIRAEYATKFGWQLPFPNEDDPGWLPDDSAS